MVLLQKLQHKNQDTLVMDGAPVEVEKLFTESSLKIVKTGTKIDFYIGFATKLTDVEKIADTIVPSLSDDALFWICYPKSTSKNYRCEFNRDTGWKSIGEVGYEPVRQISINEDWSALRFRKPAKIKKMTRSFAMTREGKKRVAENKK